MSKSLICLTNSKVVGPRGDSAANLALSFRLNWPFETEAPCLGLGKWGVWDMARSDLGLIMDAEMAARCGIADQLFNLGVLYATGRDVAQDLIAAHKWFNLAAMRGNVEAKARRAEVALEMTTAQIAEAQREARAWLMAQ